MSVQIVRQRPTPGRSANGEADWSRVTRLAEALGVSESSDLHIIHIPGAPWSKSRPRFARGHAYSKQEDVNAEARTGWYLKQSVKTPFPSNVLVACLFFRPNRQRIDTDNLLKHVCDSGNGILWKDDSQCTAILGVTELDAANPRTIVLVAEHTSSLTRGDANTYPCSVCGKPIGRAGQTNYKKTCSAECKAASKGHGVLEFRRCEQCGTEFQPVSQYRKLCSPECRTARLRNSRKGKAHAFSRCSDCDKQLTHQRGGRCRDCWKLHTAQGRLSRKRYADDTQPLGCDIEVVAL